MAGLFEALGQIGGMQPKPAISRQRMQQAGQIGAMGGVPVAYPPYQDLSDYAPVVMNSTPQLSDMATILYTMKEMGYSPQQLQGASQYLNAGGDPKIIQTMVSLAAQKAKQVLAQKQYEDMMKYRYDVLGLRQKELELQNDYRNKNLQLDWYKTQAYINSLLDKNNPLNNLKLDTTFKKQTDDFTGQPISIDPSKFAVNFYKIANLYARATGKDISQIIPDKNDMDIILSSLTNPAQTKEQILNQKLEEYGDSAKKFYDLNSKFIDNVYKVLYDLNVRFNAGDNDIRNYARDLDILNKYLRALDIIEDGMAKMKNAGTNILRERVYNETLKKLNEILTSSTTKKE